MGILPPLACSLVTSDLPLQGGEGDNVTTLGAVRVPPNRVYKAQGKHSVNVSSRFSPQPWKALLPICRKTLQPPQRGHRDLLSGGFVPCDLLPTLAMGLTSPSAPGRHSSIWTVPTPSRPTGIPQEPGYIHQLLEWRGGAPRDGEWQSNRDPKRPESHQNHRVRRQWGRDLRQDSWPSIKCS